MTTTPVGQVSRVHQHKAPALILPKWEKFVMRMAVRLAVVLLLVACSASSDGPTKTVSGSISLSVSQTALTVAKGMASEAFVTITRTGFSGVVTLGTQNVPTGVSVTFNVPTLGRDATSTSFNVNVSEQAIPGTYEFQLTASGSGVTSAAVPVSLTVPAPGIVLSAGSTAVSLTQGQRTTVPVTITRTGAYTAPVNLVASGLPAGVSATFTPTSLELGSTTSILTLTAQSTATVGAAPITITASGTGVASQTATITLTIAAAPPATIALVVGAPIATLARGAGADFQLFLARNGFTGDVQLAVSGVPAGVTATLSRTTMTGADFVNTLTIVVGATASGGTYPVTVTASGVGVATVSASITLTVPPIGSFALSLSPPSLNLQAGASATTVITITRSGGFTDLVDFTVISQVPSLGWAWRFIDANTSRLTLSAGAGLVPGTYVVTLRGTALGLTPVQVTIPVTVTPGG